jgi:glucose 1-dehydrogenase
MSALKRFEGRVALIMGGGGGMGKASALRLAAEGASVVAADISKDLADTAAAEINNNGGKARGATLDVTNEDDIIRVCNRVVEEFGHLDVMVYAAGIKSKPVPAVDFPTQEWERVFAVNLTGAFWGAREAAKHMVRGGRGSIVLISSINAMRVVPGAVAYNAAKAAVVSLAQSFGVELAKRGVRTNAIAPGQVDTPFTQGEGLLPENRRVRIDGIPMGRYGTADEMAATIAFLASDDAAFITGQTILVDGGRFAMQHRAGFPIVT